MINDKIKKSFFDILSPPFFKKRGTTQLLNVPKIIIANKCILINNFFYYFLTIINRLLTVQIKALMLYHIYASILILIVF